MFDQAFVADDGAGWPLPTLLSIFLVLMLSEAYDLGRRALMLRKRAD